MSTKKNRIGRSILSGFLAFFLTILLTAATFCISIYIGFFMNGRILNGLNYKDYYASVEDYFYQRVRDMTIPSGLPPEIVDGIVDSQTIHDDVRGYVLAALEGEDYTFHTDMLEVNLTDRIYAYFEEENLEMTSLQEETIPEYVGTISDEYVKDLKVPLIPYIAKVKQLYRKVLVAVLGGTLVLGAAIVIVLFRMYRWRHRGLRYIAYSTIATAVMTMVPAVMARTTGFYKRIGINAEHLYNAFVAYIENGINILFYVAAGWLVVTGVVLLLISFLKRKGKRKD